MSGQSSIIILVMIIATILILWGSSIFRQTSVTNIITTMELFNKFARYLDIIKGLSRNLLRLSAYKATYDVAQKERAYYCNGGYAPSYKVLVHDLEEISNKTFNSYLKNLVFSDPLLKINVTNSTCISFDVDEAKLNAGLLDESFNISEYRSTIKIIADNNNIFSENDIYSENVIRNRFWLLYRGFKRWSEQTKIFESACDDCASAACHCASESCEGCPAFNDCLKSKVIKKAVIELDKIFNDPYIECSGVPECCNINSFNDCSLLTPCGIWDTDRCMRCDVDRNENLCIDDLKAALFHGLAEAQEQDDSWYRCRLYSKTVKLSVGIAFTCADKKYTIQVPGDDRYIKFTVGVYFSLQRSGLCPSYIDTQNPPANACECQVIPAPPIPPPVPPQPGPPHPPPQPP